MNRGFRIPQLESKKAKYQARYGSNCGQGQRLNRHFDGGFRCAHCQAYVTTDILLSGVQNRNHCPYCLWSRHLDQFEAGDRLAGCKAGMQPIGLTLKQARKKYAWAQPGELMLVHQCTGCGKLSINRIAADDDVETILAVFEQSCLLDRQRIAELETGDVMALGWDQLSSVNARLFGQSFRRPAEMEYEDAVLCCS
jgi:DNA-directed RNA polymerase subunit RPC12/RpoP